MSTDMPAGPARSSATAPAQVQVLAGDEAPDVNAALVQYFERRLRLVESEAAEIRRLLKVLRPA